jgi:hypothetical protein
VKNGYKMWKCRIPQLAHNSYLGTDNSLCWGCPMYYTMFCITSSLYPPDASGTLPSHENKNIQCQMSSKAQNHPRAQNQWVSENVNIEYSLVTSLLLWVCNTRRHFISLPQFLPISNSSCKNWGKNWIVSAIIPPLSAGDIC